MATVTQQQKMLLRHLSHIIQVRYIPICKCQGNSWYINVDKPKRDNYSLTKNTVMYQYM